MKSLRRSYLPALACALGLGVLAAVPAHALEIYGQAGLPGVGLGIAQPIGPAFTLRGDVVTLGSHEKTRTEEGVTYNGKLKTRRVGLFGDWFPFGGTFRLTGGVTSNDYKLNLETQGGTADIGGTTYVLGPNDGMSVEVKFPDTTPYVGIGWGHQQASGLRFAFDLGASIGRATVTAVGRGVLASPAAQADIDRELAELRDGVGKVRALPQLSVSVGYSF